jgi:predicted dehydrogenase
VSRVRIAVAGAGLIGKRHIEEVDASASADLAAIVDPFPSGLAEKYGVPRHESLAALFAAGRPDGVILATPNHLHVEGGLECVAAGVPVIVEKPVVAGQHRNYSPIMAKAQEIVRSGALGRIVAVTGTAMFRKPDTYFDVGDGWRRKPGGGPILLNLIHEVNNLLSLVGDVVAVQAVTSSAARGFVVEDTAAIVLTFANGALGTFLLSDAAASPRSWEQTSQENLAYATHPDEDCYHIAGTDGSLSVPTMRLRTYAGEHSWYVPFESSVVPLERSDPLANQITHFAEVIRGEAEPICSGRDGLKTLQVVEAIAEAARTGSPVALRHAAGT